MKIKKVKLIKNKKSDYTLKGNQENEPLYIVELSEEEYFKVKEFFKEENKQCYCVDKED